MKKFRLIFMTHWHSIYPQIERVGGGTYDESTKTLRERSRVDRDIASEDTYWNQR